MVCLITGIYAKLLLRYSRKWEAEKDRTTWEKWDEYEDLRTDFGHTTDIVKIPRRRHPPRKKHGHK